MRLQIGFISIIIILILLVATLISDASYILIQDGLTIARFLVYSFGLFLLTIGLAGTTFGVMILIENYRTRRAARIKAEKEAHTLVIESAQHGVFVRDTDRHSIYRALHLNPAYRQNGIAADHNETDLAMWQAFTLRNRAKVELPEQQLLSGGNVQNRTAFELWNEAVHLAIIGGTGSGKTTLANHLIDHIKINTMVLDPHANLNNWSTNASVVYRYKSIEEALGLEVVEMQSRYTTGVTTPQHLIVMDEWPAVVDECPQAGEYLKRLSREGRKVGICLILISQSDLVQDLGANTSVRENFLRLFLRPDMMRKNQALIRHWDNQREVIELPGQYNGKGQEMIIGGLPTDEEQRILEAAKQYDSNRKITEAVWGKGKFGSHYNEKVKRVLRKQSERGSHSHSHL